METLINSQLPQADDIDFRSLEYLFVPREEPSHIEPPWVDVIIEPVQSDNVDLLRLSARAKVLEERLTESVAQLADANIQIGFLRGLIAEREEQLKQLPDLRIRAAKSIASDHEHRKLQILVKRLEAENAELARHPVLQLEKNVKRLLSIEVSNRFVLVLELAVSAAFLLLAAVAVPLLRL